MICRKCGKEMDGPHKDRFGKSWFCYNCGHGVIIPYKLRGIFWNLLYSLKYFFMDFRKIMGYAKQKLGRINRNE